MTEHLSGEAGIAQHAPNLPTEYSGHTLFDRLRNRWSTLVAVGTAALAIGLSPTYDERPAMATEIETVDVGMPFQGNWAYSSLTSAACGPESGETSHPSCHEIYSGDWSTDLYQAAGTEVKLRVGGATGDLELEWGSATGSCGESLRVNVKVDEKSIGWVYFTHLTAAVDTAKVAPSDGLVIGKIANLTCNPGGPGKKHVHVEVKNASDDTNACYKNYSTTDHTAGHILAEGTKLGLIGSANNGDKQECGTASSDPDTDADGAKDSKDDCPTINGNPNAPYYGCPTHDPTPSNVPLTAESPYGTALTSWGSHRLDAFRVNASGRMEHKFFADGVWSGWNLLEPDASQDVTIVGKPAATSWGWGRIDVFGIGTDGKIKQKLIDNNSGWSPWVDLPALPNNPDCLKNGLAATHWGQGNLDVFGIGCSTNSLKHLWLRNNQWQGWEDQGGCIQNAPAAAAWGTGRIDTFVRGCDNALYTKVVEGSWSDWVGLGGCLSSGPAVASQKANSLDVFARGCGGAGNSLLHMAYRGSTNAWSPWQNWGGNIAQAPSAVSWWPNRLDVIGTDPSNQTTHFHFDRGVPGSGWNPL